MLQIGQTMFMHFVFLVLMLYNLFVVTSISNDIDTRSLYVYD
jgi:hypothetical protein